MKRKNAWLLLLSAILLAACQVNKSTSVNTVIGMTTKGDGLSCTKVYLTNEAGKVDRNEFVYGEKLEIHFADMEGFTLKGKEAFPGMSLTIVSKAGDTILHSKDVYADYPDKIDMSPLELTAFFTAARPLRSKQAYRLFIHIRDKKGKGTFDATLNFTIKPNPALKHQATRIQYEEIYLFDKAANKGITDDRIAPEKEIYMIFEGLKGFRAVNGKADVVIAIRLKDNLGTVILDEKDLTNGVPLDAATVAGQIAPNFVIHDGSMQNPLKLEVIIYDREKPTIGIHTTATLNLEGH